MREKILKVTDRVNQALLLISSFLLLIATVLAVLNAVLRFVKLGGFTWADELCTISMIALVYFAQPNLEFKNKQLCIGVLQSSLKNPVAKRAFHILRGIITIAITGMMLRYCIMVTEKSAEHNYITSVLHVPRIYLYGIMLLAFAIIILSWIITIFVNGGRGAETETDLGVVDRDVIESQLKDTMLQPEKAKIDTDKKDTKAAEEGTDNG